MTSVFEDELNDMTKTFKSYLKDLPFNFGGHSDITFEEVPYQNYRTDIVGVRINRHQWARRRKILGSWNALPDERKYRNSYRTLQSLEPITRDEWINEDSTYAEQSARSAWSWLLQNGFLKDTPNGMVTARIPNVSTVYAFELKQHDWEEALHQASRAEHYADYCTVVMDAGAREDVTERKFDRAGVGLVYLDRDGLEVAVQTDKRFPLRTSTRMLVNERAIDQVPYEVKEEAYEKYQEAYE